MNKLILAILLCINTTAWAQNQTGDHAKVLTSDQAILVEPGQMPLPPPPNDGRHPGTGAPTRAADGVSALTNDPRSVKQFFNKVDVVRSVHSSQNDLDSFNAAVHGGAIGKMAPVVIKDLSSLKLTFKPSTPNNGKLIGVSPQGTVIGDRWTGVETYFEIQGGVLCVSELDLKASGGGFYMNKSSANTQVGGKPAHASILKDDAARQIEEVMWMNDGKLVTVTYAPEMTMGRFGLSKANSSVSALSIANSLR